MPRSKLFRLIISVASGLIIVGVLLMTWMLSTEDERNVIEVKLEIDETQSIEFKTLVLVPGDECEYIIKMKKDGSAQYDLYLDFEETEDKTLKNFARVKILSNEEVLVDELLANVFENEPIVLPIDFYKNQNTDLKIVYYLPIEIGNEAKNAEALFELLLTAKTSEVIYE